MGTSIRARAALAAAMTLLLVATAGCDGGTETCPGGEIIITELQVGSGVVADDSSRVSVTYTGELEDGRQVANEGPVTVNLYETAPPGFRQGVAGMRENGRRRFRLPPSLGFGPDGGPAGIPSCARLVFTVELHDVLAPGCSNSAPDVITEDPVVGTGAQAMSNSRVRVNSTLSLLDGTVIETRTDQTLLLSDPSVLEGIRRGIPGMLEGGVRRVFIPPNFGFGAGGLPPTIPPCATLIYDVELLEVLP
jgi:FKBP-type peptidyl-prolyl cis-trans isomerase